MKKKNLDCASRVPAVDGNTISPVFIGCPRIKPGQGFKAMCVDDDDETWLVDSSLLLTNPIRLAQSIAEPGRERKSGVVGKGRGGGENRSGGGIGSQLVPLGLQDCVGPSRHPKQTQIARQEGGEDVLRRRTIPRRPHPRPGSTRKALSVSSLRLLQHTNKFTYLL